MKTSLIFFIFLYHNAFAGPAIHAKISPSFTSEDFVKLSVRDQNEFILEMRSLLSDLSQDPGVFSQFIQKWDPQVLQWLLGEMHLALATEASSEVHQGTKLNVSAAATDPELNFIAANAAIKKFRDEAGDKKVLTKQDLNNFNQALLYLLAEATNLSVSSSATAEQKQRVRSMVSEIFREATKYKVPDASEIPYYAGAYASRIAKMTGGGEIARPEFICASGPCDKLTITDHGTFLKPDGTSPPKTRTPKAIAEAGELKAKDSQPIRLADAHIKSSAERTGGTQVRLKAEQNQPLAQGEDRPDKKRKAKAPSGDHALDQGKTQRGDHDLDQGKAPNGVQSHDETSKKFEFSACMYGGFILVDGSCTAPKKLPDSFLKQNIFDPKVFVCPSGELLCNPLFFGFEMPEDCDLLKDQKKCLLTATPVCTAISTRATFNCKEKTKNQKYVERSAFLAKSFPKFLDEFIKDFQQLCGDGSTEKNRFIYFDANGKERTNSNYYKKDIQETCKVANSHWSEISQQFLQKAAATAGSGPAMAKGPAASTGVLPGAGRAPGVEASKDGLTPVVLPAGGKK